MNHCIDVICAECGYTYCAIGCTDKEQDQQRLKQAFAIVVSRNEPVYHYKHLSCRSCRSQQVHEWPATMHEALKELSLMFNPMQKTNQNSYDRTH